MTIHAPILPGATIGILGGGQLGKMSAMAAAQLGYHTTIYAKAGDNPAMEVATDSIIVPEWDDPAGIAELVSTCAVITTEWENVPLSLAQEIIRQGGIFRPGIKVLEVAQSRFREKLLASELQIPTTKTAWIPGVVNLTDDWSDYLPGILKTDGQGYDGKGQFSVNTVEELIAAREKTGVACVLEKRVDLAYELSVLVARTADEQIMVSDVVENTHKNGILDRTEWPPFIRPWNRQRHFKAQEYAKKVAEHLDLEGILCLEFFVDKVENLLFNEMAPRPHNSFHGSIEAAFTSQFEQHVRAICNLPLGDVRFHTPFEMLNLIGGTWEDDWSKYLLDQRARLHLYGKGESRADRKMGHVTRLLRVK